MNTATELTAVVYFCYKKEFVIIKKTTNYGSLKRVPLIIIFQKLGPIEDFFKNKKLIYIFC